LVSLVLLLAATVVFAACSSDAESVDGSGEDGAIVEETDTTAAAADATTDDDANDGDATDGDAAGEDASDEETTAGGATDGDTSDPDANDEDTSDDGTGDDTGTGAESGTAGVAADIDVAVGCEEIASLFGTNGSANPDMADPESSAVCDGDTVVISANAIPDYTYIETSPGPPRAQDLTYEIPAAPTVAAATTAVPLIGSLGVTLAGIPIFGPTEGTGGDVGSINGILMECGSHNGPTGFHLHLVGTSDTTDCDFSPEEIASGPQLLGYAFDGYPIYTGNDQYTPSWQLTDESLFATDTWAAHSYVEGSGDLDECNGLTDADGNYAYYTTDAFPYVIGCFVGEVEIGGGAGGGGGGQGPPPGDDDAQGPPPGGGGGQGPPPARDEDA
jgi:hypothetical protein